MAHEGRNDVYALTKPPLNQGSSSKAQYHPPKALSRFSTSESKVEVNKTGRTGEQYDGEPQPDRSL